MQRTSSSIFYPDLCQNVKILWNYKGMIIFGERFVFGQPARDKILILKLISHLLVIEHETTPSSIYYTLLILLYCGDLICKEIRCNKIFTYIIKPSTQFDNLICKYTRKMLEYSPTLKYLRTRSCFIMNMTDF